MHIGTIVGVCFRRDLRNMVAWNKKGEIDPSFQRMDVGFRVYLGFRGYDVGLRF